MKIHPGTAAVSRFTAFAQLADLRIGDLLRHRILVSSLTLPSNLVTAGMPRPAVRRRVVPTIPTPIKKGAPSPTR